MGSQICWFTGLQESVRQSGDLIVYAPLDWKSMKLLQSLGDANASPLTCDNTSERALQTKPRNVFNRDPHEGRVGVIEATADERTDNVINSNNLLISIATEHNITIHWQKHATKINCISQESKLQLLLRESNVIDKVLRHIASIKEIESLNGIKRAMCILQGSDQTT